jgi:glutamyl-tRNA reductase
MIQYKCINNGRFTLEEREALAKTANMDERLPHVLLKTCNRIELYWGEGEIPEEVVRHLFRVAGGLESAITGERAIQGQVKDAYRTACEKYRLSGQLHKLFQTAIHAGKRVRAETGISEGAVSHSQATVEMLKREQVDLRQKIVGIIGVNKLTEDVLKYLAAKGAANIFLSNRNFERAGALAEKYRGTAIALDEKKRLLEFADVLICATAAPHVIIREEDVPPGKEMLIFDLAFPRDVDASIALRKGVKLYNLEDVEEFARRNLLLRRCEIAKAERIIEEEADKLYDWHACTKNLKP